MTHVDRRLMNLAFTFSHNGRHAALYTYTARRATVKARQRGIAQRQGTNPSPTARTYEGIPSSCFPMPQAPPYPPLPRHPPIPRPPLILPSHQWDHAISSILVKSTLGFSFGILFSVLLFKRRAWPVYFSTGVGAGRGWEDADGKSFRRLMLGIGRVEC